MPLRLDIKRKLSARSDRVKSVDVHPSEPWVLSALYNGHLFLWNYNTQSLVKSFEVTDLPVRCAKFIARKQWVISGSDDMQIRVYNYNTMEKVKVWEAHSDYIRCIAVHPTQPVVVSSSDDMSIKLWDWEKGWQNTMVYEGHSHYVMMVVFNPKDANTFASASLDKTIKVWGLHNANPHFTLEGHEKGVNCIDYFAGGDRPYLVSGADDKMVKVWDYQTKQCVQTMEGHQHNVATICCHPELPLILTGGEDGTVRLWHAATYRMEGTLSYAFERCWSIAALRGTHRVAIGYDEGTIMVRLGREDPIASMDPTGKITWAKHNEIQQANLRAVTDEVADGERLPLTTKELDVCEIYPQTLQHNRKGQLAVVCGDGEYIIYTALAWRKKSFGQALDFVWGMDTAEYAVRESLNGVKVFKQFKETHTFRPPLLVEAIFGGALLGVRNQEVIMLYDWAECRLVRRIDVCPREIYWNEAGDLVALACEESFYVLRYNKEVANACFESGEPIPDDGIEIAFELLYEVQDSVRTAVWVGDCFIYTNGVEDSPSSRLNYTVGGQVVTLQHLDQPLYLVGYLPKENKLYLLDKSNSVVAYTLLLSVLEYQTAVVRRDFAAAAAVLPSIPQSEHNRIARFLEAQGFPNEALQVATDTEHRFELAVQLGKLDVTYEICQQADQDAKWRQLSDMALKAHNLALAEEGMVRASDYGGLLMLHTSTGDADKVDALALEAERAGKTNIAFVCLFLRGKVHECLELLVRTGRVPEAAFFARTFAPSQMSSMVALWKAELEAKNPKAAQAIADPAEYPNLFEKLDAALRAEEWAAANRSQDLPASAFPEHENDAAMDLIEHVASILAAGGAPPPPPQAAQAQAEPEAEAEPHAAEPMAEAVAEPEPEPMPEPEPEPVPAAVAEPVPAAVAEPEAVPEPAAEPQAALEPEMGDDLDAELAAATVSDRARQAAATQDATHA